jgi:threonine/homoserine/homoserine lactone efflux protein
MAGVDVGSVLRMVSAGRLLTFVGVVALVIAIPGPSVVFTISRALTAGRRTALHNVMGNAIGLAIQVVAVAAGLGAVVQRSAEVFGAVKFAGAGYLVYLGVQAIRHRRALAEAIGDRTGSMTPARAVRDGVVVGALNPKTIAVMVALLPQFAVTSAGHLTVQLLVLGSVFPLSALALDSLWAVAAGSAAQWLSTSPRKLTAIGGASGVVMIGLGASLAVTGRKD